LLLVVHAFLFLLLGGSISAGAPLCEGGEERALTVDSLPAYVECTARFWLEDGIK
jgi:hypothetical protein